MLVFQSFNEEINTFINENTFDFVTFDLESRDSGSLDIWDAEIISSSFCFVQKNPENTPLLPTFYLFGQIIEDITEEKTFLENLYRIFKSMQDRCIITGHNIGLNLPCKRRFSHNSHGYDFKKLVERGNTHNLNFAFLHTLEYYDTMNEAFYYYDHTLTPRFQVNGRTKRMLKSEEVEQDFHIIRPDTIPKLGPRVREIYDTKDQKNRLSLLMKYNIIDTVVEAVMTMIFQEQQKYFKKISPQLPHNVLEPPIQIKNMEIYQFIDKI